ncbi:1,4-alpha-glucan branching protein GlgB [Candidatus Nephthysia bennettiae]|uniref:1,4-alpha-glucan branching protein GlgB n=1 Tax=Candidatus Nephthysia bennettiae TaxID=3127016 RepID=UPI0030C684A5
MSVAPGQRGLLSDDDLHLFNEGSHYHLGDAMGAHPVSGGTWFGIWAPAAAGVSVIGDFNGWDPNAHPLEARAGSGVWEGLVPQAAAGAIYKYRVASAGGRLVDKADPLAFHTEVPPRTGSVVWHLDHGWGDDAWMRHRHEQSPRSAPWSIYELHAGSWMRVPGEGGRSLSYRELAPRLGDYVEGLGFTHVELLPVMEHPFFGSWGYQTTGYFAPSSRYGTPQDLMYLVDHLHQRGIGVILDWVPSHFPGDEHGLRLFDGTPLYEHSDPQRGFHPDWNSCIFDYGRPEVRSFLISSALFWLERFHADALRVDGVASMLYLDYSRKPGEWTPNAFGGRENLEAADLLRQLNTAVYAAQPDTQTIAEESTSWPLVSRPTYLGGLGFGMKWDMGWMHDTLQYFQRDPVHRKYHHRELTFRAVYAFDENFTLPLSHDEVVYGKGSLIGKMPGDDWQKRANLRLLFGWMYATPGKKLVFMGGEFGQRREWDHDGELDWSLAADPAHTGISRWLADLNRLYREEPALHGLDFDPAGFEWVDASDAEQSVVTLIRSGGGRRLLAVFNFTPMRRVGYRTGVPLGGSWRELLNSDAETYGGGGWGNLGATEAEEVPWHGRPHSLALTLPALSAVFFAGETGFPPGPLPQSYVRESMGSDNSDGRSESGLSGYAGPCLRGGELR